MSGLRAEKQRDGADILASVCLAANDLGPGVPLDVAIRAEMEFAFGHDFSSVRIHSDHRIARIAQMLNARAFAIGNDLGFAPGSFDVQTLRGQRLIAHELAHVVQQGGSVPTGRIPDRSGESLAEAAAERVVSGGSVRLGVRTVTGPQLEGNPPNHAEGRIEPLDTRLVLLKDSLTRIRENADIGVLIAIATLVASYYLPLGGGRSHETRGTVLYEIDRTALLKDGFSPATVELVDAIFREAGFRPRDVIRSDWAIDDPQGRWVHNATADEADAVERQRAIQSEESARAQARRLFWDFLSVFAGISSGRQQIQSVASAMEIDRLSSESVVVGPPGTGVARSAGKHNNELGVLREAVVAKIFGGRWARDPRVEHPGNRTRGGKQVQDERIGLNKKVRVDVIGPNGEAILVGGRKKGEVPNRESSTLGEFRKAAAEEGRRAIAVYTEDTPTHVIETAEKLLGEGNVFILKGLPASQVNVSFPGYGKPREPDLRK